MIRQRVFDCIAVGTMIFLSFHVFRFKIDNSGADGSNVS